MYPVIVYEEGVELPKEGTYYVVAGNGCFLHKNTGIVSCFVKVKSVPFLQDLPDLGFVKCNLPKLPAKLVASIKELFTRVVATYKSEANTLLFFNKETQEFQVRVPKQKVTHSGVGYKNELATTEENPDPDFLLVGTIHSHADFEAFHSGTDDHDEENFDGLHVTFGHNHEKVFTISASVVVNGKRDLVPPCDVLEGLEAIGDKGYYRISSECELDEDQLTQWMGNISHR